MLYRAARQDWPMRYPDIDSSATRASDESARNPLPRADSGEVGTPRQKGAEVRWRRIGARTVRAVNPIDAGDHPGRKEETDE